MLPFVGCGPSGGSSGRSSSSRSSRSPSIHLAPGSPSQIDPLNPRFTPEQLSALPGCVRSRQAPLRPVRALLPAAVHRPAPRVQGQPAGPAEDRASGRGTASRSSSSGRPRLVLRLPARDRAPPIRRNSWFDRADDGARLRADLDPRLLPLLPGDHLRGADVPGGRDRHPDVRARPRGVAAGHGPHLAPRPALGAGRDGRDRRALPVRAVADAGGHRLGLRPDRAGQGAARGRRALPARAPERRSSPSSRCSGS